MKTLLDLLTGDSVGHSILLLSMIVALGVSMGRIRVFGLRLGVAGVLFSGLAFGHFHLTIDHHLLEFIREFGLILFVYTIGLQVGPGFFSSLKRDGLRLNLLAAASVCGGFLITVVYVVMGWIPAQAAVGLMAGGTTNTPSLAAGMEALRQVQGLSKMSLQLPGMAYAVAYPFGILGIILSMVATKNLFRIKAETEAEEFNAQQADGMRQIGSFDLNVENQNLDGMCIRDVPFLKNSQIVISRVLHAGKIELARPETALHIGDIIHVVGPTASLLDLAVAVGSMSHVDLRAQTDTNVVSRHVVLTKADAVGRTVSEVGQSGFRDATITRISRAGIDFPATAETELQYADTLTVVGSREGLKRLATVIGDTPKELATPHMIPLFVGLALGVVLGSIPIALPGLPSPVKLGLAGGPLLVAILLSRLGHVGRMVWWMPVSSNLMLREFGIALFLACVGLSSGGTFVETLIRGPGLAWMGAAALITVAPILTVAAVARRFLRLNYLTICGVIAGSMTDPPALAFASAQAKSNATSLAYAAVYPLTMILRVLGAQLLVILFAHP